ncbi:MAG: energy transducer TonB [Candidatus Methylomirabilota bacterium]
MMDNPALFRGCLAASLAVHAGLLLAGRLLPRLPSPLPPLEVDLSLGMPMLGPKAAGRPGGAPGGSKAPEPAKLAAPQAMAPAVPVTSPVFEAKPPEPVRAAARIAEWLSQKSPAQPVEKPAEPAPAPGGVPGGAGTAAAPGGSGPGARVGMPDGTGTIPAGTGTGPGGAGGSGPPGGGSGLVSLPRLLNGAEVRAGMQRLFPESERAADRQGKVVLMLHIGADGRAEPGDIVQSAGPAFDAAAKEVVKLMRFEPARNSAGPVAVKIKQPVIFQLQD